MQALILICYVDAKDYMLVTPKLAGIAARELGAPVADLSINRKSIIEALDLLVTGI